MTPDPAIDPAIPGQIYAASRHPAVRVWDIWVPKLLQACGSLDLAVVSRCILESNSNYITWI
jgi:hypothetical protein